MEVEAFLADGGGRKDERPERGVEGVPYTAKPCDGVTSFTSSRALMPASAPSMRCHSVPP